MGRLTAWSFLMATAHGAGLMVLPVFLGMSQTVHAASCHASAAPAAQGDVMTGLLATVVHGVGYLAVTAAAAWIVFTKLGVGLLRTAWINLDLVWAIALIFTGAMTAIL
ncbi:MAG: hypothetical protein ACK5AZ_18635 [Bryobacteraceae bacterium]